jgi:hypothetical protein
MDVAHWVARRKVKVKTDDEEGGKGGEATEEAKGK